MANIQQMAAQMPWNAPDAIFGQQRLEDRMTEDKDLEILGDAFDDVMNAVSDACDAVGLTYVTEGDGNLDPDDFNDMVVSLAAQLAAAMRKAGLISP